MFPVGFLQQNVEGRADRFQSAEIFLLVSRKYFLGLHEDLIDD